MDINKLRSKFKKEIEIIREKVHKRNLFISLSGIDEIIKLLEKLNLKGKIEIQEALLETVLHYATRLCRDHNVRLINEDLITQAIQEVNRVEVDLIKKIQSIRVTQTEETEPLQEELEVITPEKLTNIKQLRTKYKKEIEIIKDKVDRNNLFISLGGIDELITLFEPINLEKSLLATYLEKLLDYAIISCQDAYERLINENHIKQAILDVNSLEVDLMKKILPTERVEVSETEQQPEQVETIPEVSEISTPEKQPEEVEVLEKEEVISTFEEIPTEEEILPKVIEKSIPEKEPEEIVPPKPKIIDCPFCGLVKNEAATFCPQCGMIFKE